MMGPQETIKKNLEMRETSLHKFLELNAVGPLPGFIEELKLYLEWKALNEQRIAFHKQDVITEFDRGRIAGMEQLSGLLDALLKTTEKKGL